MYDDDDDLEYTASCYKDDGNVEYKKGTKEGFIKAIISYTGQFNMYIMILVGLRFRSYIDGFKRFLNNINIQHRQVGIMCDQYYKRS